MKHTAGPWIIKRHHGTYDPRGKGHIEILHPLINTEDDEYKGKIGGYHVVIGDKNCQDGFILEEANAHLIAAAPDLLEAGKQVLVLLEKFVPKKYLAIGMENLKKAISKAEGE